MPFLALGPLSSFVAFDRYLLTLRSLSSSTSSSRQVVLFRLARQGLDAFYAIEAECPHAGAPMIDSELEFGDADSGDIEDLDTVIAVCPWHSYDFDLRTGESSMGVTACTWKVHVVDKNGTRTVMMEGPENSGEWQIDSIDAVSEAFVEPTLPPIVPLSPPTTLTDWACLILQTPHPDEKVSLTREALRLLRSGKFSYPNGIIGQTLPPDKPPRLPAREDAKPPKMGKTGSSKSQIVYLHNITHIEQWAIDLAWDLIARFARPFVTNGTAGTEEKANDGCMPLSFFEDWAIIAEEEAKHFTLLRARLEAKGSFYGQFKTQDGLWDSAHSTRDDIKARLSIVCLVHEARGLDVNPGQIVKFRALGDTESVDAMTVVHADEISHVAAGHRYLQYVCAKEGLDPVQVFRENVRKHFEGRLKGPFNREDRRKAGLNEEWYAGDW